MIILEQYHNYQVEAHSVCFTSHTVTCDQIKIKWKSTKITNVHITVSHLQLKSAWCQWFSWALTWNNHYRIARKI